MFAEYQRHIDGPVTWCPENFLCCCVAAIEQYDVHIVMYSLQKKLAVKCYESLHEAIANITHTHRMQSYNVLL